MPAPEIRYLTEQEMNAMLTADTPCYLATIANGGVPRVTPVWFVWDGHAFVMTSFETKRHVGDLQRNAKAAVCIELEQRVSGID